MHRGIREVVSGARGATAPLRVSGLGILGATRYKNQCSISSDLSPRKLFVYDGIRCRVSSPASTGDEVSTSDLL